MKIAVYTAIFGNIDRLWSVHPLAVGDADYIAFSDQPLREVGLWSEDSPSGIRKSTRDMGTYPTWQVERVKAPYGPRRTARHYKALAHYYLTKYDVWIWLDGNVRLMIPPEQIVKDYLGKANLAIFKHPERNCLYEEAEFCAKVGKDSTKVLRQQTRHYEVEGMPRKWGLPETRCVIRRNTERVQELNAKWWHELQEHSVRDQVSLPFVCWKLNMRWKEIPGRCYAGNKHKHFHYIRHKV